MRFCGPFWVSGTVGPDSTNKRSVGLYSERERVVNEGTY